MVSNPHKKARIKKVKTHHSIYLILLDFNGWYIGGDFLLNRDSSAYYNLVDNSGNIEPHTLLFLHAKVAYKYYIKEGLR